VVDIKELATPAAAGSLGTALTQGPDGTVFLAWMEPAGARGMALKFATLDAYRRSWSEPRLIAQGTDFARRRRGHAGAGSAGGRPDAGGVASREYHRRRDGPSRDFRKCGLEPSDDGGATWSASQPLSRESEATDLPR